jgi:hypothetical protein
MIFSNESARLYYYFPKNLNFNFFLFLSPSWKFCLQTFPIIFLVFPNRKIFLKSFFFVSYFYEEWGQSFLKSILLNGCVWKWQAFTVLYAFFKFRNHSIARLILINRESRFGFPAFISFLNRRSFVPNLSSLGSIVITK